MKLLIVDDDLQIRTGLEQGIEWSTLGIETVLTAADGDEALQIFLKELPDVVITDIRMPGLDGLALSREIRKHAEKTSIIVLSGYSDFEYARQAMQSQVKDYLLKPVKIMELMDLVSTIINKKIQEEAVSAEHLRQAHAVQERFLQELIANDFQNLDNQLAHLMKMWHLDQDDALRFILVEIDQAWKIPNRKDREQCFRVLCQNLPQMLGEELVSHVFLKHQCVLLLKNHETSEEALRVRLIEAAKYFNQTYNSTTVTLASGVAFRPKDLHLGYRSSENALAQKLYKGCAVALVSSQEMTHWSTPMEMPEPKGLENCIRLCDAEQARDMLLALFTALHEAKCTDRSWVMHLCVSLRQLLIKTVKSEGYDFEGLFERNITLYEHLEQLETLKEFQEWICDLYSLVLTGLADMKGARSHVSVRKAVEWINKNFSRDLTLEMVADEVQKSPNYFSHLFKKEMGISFSEYLNRVRIQESKNYLRTSNLLAYEIAEKVGFADYKYFTQIFRKMEGCSPTDYRKGKHS